MSDFRTIADSNCGATLVEIVLRPKELVYAQVASVQSYLMQELMILQAQIFSDADHAQFSEQRTEIVLLNR